MLRLLVVVPFSPRLDAPHGGRVIAQLLAHLAVRHRLALVYLRRPGSPPVDEALSSHVELVEEVPLPSPRPFGARWQRRRQVLTAPLRTIPSPAAVTFDRQLGRTVAAVATRWRPDVVQVEHDALAYCAHFMGAAAPARVLVCHEPGAHAAADLADATRGRQRLAHRVDAWTWRRYWARTIPSFDAVVTFSERDRKVMAGAAPTARIVAIPLGLDVPSQALRPVRGTRHDIVFVGGYTHPPNADAALRLIRSIVPRVRVQVDDVRLHLVGDAPTADMLRAAGLDDTITGRVEDVRPYLERAQLVVLPLRLGGGTRVKLLEALAAGKAVVASPLATAGVDVTDGEQLVLADTDDEFADAIVALLRDDARRGALGRAARSWAVANLGWDARVREYEALYRSVLDARS